MNLHPEFPMSLTFKQCVLTLFLIVFAGTFAFGQTKSKTPSSKTTSPAVISSVDPRIVGVWGVDERGGYEFRADGTFIMEGTVTYNYDAANGLWHYWQASMPDMKLAGDYKVSADGRSLSINLTQGNPLTHLKKVKK
jgi:hypothetical protein